MAQALIGLGANLGDRAAALDAARRRLEATPGITVLRVSRGRQTAAIGGPPGQPPYLNAAATLETSLSPAELLARLQAIEAELGRQRGVAWGPRTIDLDLLLFGDLVLDAPELTVPHPWMAVRRFVLEPAAEIAASWRHPRIGWTLDELLRHLNTSRPYAAITGLPGSGKTRLAEAAVARTGGRLLSLPPETAVSSAAGGDQAGPAWAVEIEFLAARTRQLSASAWPADAPWVVSDYWFGQSLAHAVARLPSEGQREFRREFAAREELVVAPRLIVWMETSGARLAAEGRRVDAALAGLLLGAGRGPVLRLASGEPLERQAALLLAALESAA